MYINKYILRGFAQFSHFDRKKLMKSTVRFGGTLFSGGSMFTRKTGEFTSRTGSFANKQCEMTNKPQRCRYNLHLSNPKSATNEEITKTNTPCCFFILDNGPIELVMCECSRHVSINQTVMKPDILHHYHHFTTVHAS